MDAALCRWRRVARGPILGRRRLRLQAQDRLNGEQQIYVDPRYAGRATTPLGLDPFRVRDGVLSIIATRTPPELKSVLFDNEYISGILTTQSSFAQKHGYFEIRSKIPVGTGVWPAFWLLANDGGWPPEIDVVEGRGEGPGAFVMTTHWRYPDTQKIESCGLDFTVPDAPDAFPRLWRAVGAGPHHLFRRPQAGRRHQGAGRLRRSDVHDRESGDGREVFQGRRICRAPKRRGRSHSRSTGCPSIRSIVRDRSSRVHEIFRGGILQSLQVFRRSGSRPHPPRRRKRKPSKRPTATRLRVSQGFSLGHGDLRLSDRGRRQRRRPRPVDLGHFRPYARQHRGSQQRRPRQRSLSPLQGRRCA